MGRLIDADKLRNIFLKSRSKTFDYSVVVKEIDYAPTVEAIPKADIQKALKEGSKDISENILAIVREEYISKAEYENRLKADLVAMLEDLDLQIDELAVYNREYAKIQRLIRDRINKLKENKDAI